MKINITIPVYNEEKDLPVNARRLLNFLRTHCRFLFEVVIADNASNDGTLAAARRLCAEDSSIKVIHLDGKGRGRAIKKAWIESDADVLSYMDVDLASDLMAFPPLIESIVSGSFDLAIGSRLLDSRLTKRSHTREFISRSYNWLVRLMFDVGFSDAQCGFKAISRKAASHLLPLVEDDEWFMDTELLLLAERFNYKIFDLAIKWVDDPDSRVAICSTAWKDIQGLLRMRRRFASGIIDRRPGVSQPQDTCQPNNAIR